MKEWKRYARKELSFRKEKDQRSIRAKKRKAVEGRR
jgi:hypothetical protein